MPILTEHHFSLTVCTENNATHAMVKTMTSLMQQVRVSIDELPRAADTPELPLENRCTRYTFRSDQLDALKLVQTFLQNTLDFLCVEYTES